jgi:outer membrane lipoprotein-sorting protein
MRFDDGGRSRSVAVLALLVAIVGVVAVAGFALGAIDAGQDDRTGEEVLSDAQETYDDADSVVTDAVVTVEVGNHTTEFEVSAATAGEDRARLNLSSGGYYVLTGVDNGTVWRYDSLTELTGVLDRDGNSITASLRAGSEAPARPDLSALPGDFDMDTELSELLDAFDGELPEDIDGQLEELPENTTVGELLANDSLRANLDDGILSGTDGELPDAPGAFEIPEEWAEFNISEKWSDLKNSGEWAEFNISEKWSDLKNSGEWGEMRLNRSIEDVLTGTFNSSALTVERVGTATIDGTEANELLLSHPDVESETRVWTDAETDTLLRQETTTPLGRVTVDVLDTRFDVSPADSTFEPPGASELASLSLSTAESADGFVSAAPFGAAVPGEGWTVERGAVLSGEAPSLTEMTGLESTDIAAATYTDGESSVVVSQVDRVVDLETVPLFGFETVVVGDREVHLLSGRYGAVGVWSEAGTTVAIAGDVSGEELRSVIAEIEFRGSGG